MCEWNGGEAPLCVALSVVDVNRGTSSSAVTLAGTQVILRLSVSPVTAPAFPLGLPLPLCAPRLRERRCDTDTQVPAGIPVLALRICAEGTLHRDLQLSPAIASPLSQKALLAAQQMHSSS